MKHTDKPTTTASASQNCEHVTTKYVDQCDTCGQYVAPDKRTIPAEKPTVADPEFARINREQYEMNEMYNLGYDTGRDDTRKCLEAQAAQLAEALQKLHLSIGSGHEYEAVKQAKQALAAYEEGK